MSERRALTFAILQHVLGFRWRDLGKTLLHSAVLASASLLVPVALLMEYGDQIHYGFVRILLATLGCAIGFAAAAFLTRHPITHEVKLVLAAIRRIT